MRDIKRVVTLLNLLLLVVMLGVSCSSSGSGGGGTGEGIYNTTWDVLVYENGFLIDGGFITIDGSGNLTGGVGEGPLTGTVHGDGSAAAWTTSKSSTASGSLDGNSGTGSGTWRDSEGYTGTWQAIRR